jgi:hypothetical protein
MARRSYRRSSRPASRGRRYGRSTGARRVRSYSARRGRVGVRSQRTQVVRLELVQAPAPVAPVAGGPIISGGQLMRVPRPSF